MIINIDDINTASISNLIENNFNQVNSNITPMKILSLLGISIHNQKTSSQEKQIRSKIKAILKELSSQGLIQLKATPHETLGIKEIAYKKLSGK